VWIRSALRIRTDGGELPISSSTEPRINERIRTPRVRLIGIDGSQLGIFAIADAQRIADEQDFDLVEIAPLADPPVARIMDYSKFKYEQAQKEKLARKHQTKVEIKEIKFRPKIDKHDYETKKKHVLRFLAANAKVKVTIMFRGREMAHPELGLNILEKLAGELGEDAIIETQPKLEGRNMHMLLAPVKKKEVKETAEVEESIEPTETIDTTETTDGDQADETPIATDE
jgi:translation initiation factor IF-3